MYDDTPHGFGHKKFGYKIYPNIEKIIVLRTMEDLDNFIDKYLNSKPDYESERFGDGYNIDWDRVTQDYSGIEMPTYDNLDFRDLWRKDSKRYKWLYNWDVPSGCVWKSDGISRIKSL